MAEFKQYIAGTTLLEMDVKFSDGEVITFASDNNEFESMTLEQLGEVIASKAGVEGSDQVVEALETRLYEIDTDCEINVAALSNLQAVSQSVIGDQYISEIDPETGAEIGPRPPRRPK